MKMMSKVCTLLLSAVLCVGMAAPAFAYGGDTEEVEPPVLTASSLSRWSASRATRSIWSSTGTARVRIPSTL